MTRQDTLLRDTIEGVLNQIRAAGPPSPAAMTPQEVVDNLLPMLALTLEDALAQTEFTDERVADVLTRRAAVTADAADKSALHFASALFREA